jgi:hypothetical protein
MSFQRRNHESKQHEIPHDQVMDEPRLLLGTQQGNPSARPRFPGRACKIRRATEEGHDEGDQIEVSRMLAPAALTSMVQYR